MRRFFLLVTACICVAVFFSGCSRKAVPPPPKTQPELLLEIYDAARRHQYNAALLKIQKMRALDPTSVFLAELENTIRFNRLSAVVNTYLNMGKFDAALAAIEDYERKYGATETSSKTREQLLFITRLDHQIRKIKAARHSDQLEKEIAKIKILIKDADLSAKIMNFIKNKESVIPELRDCERIMTLREIRQMAEDSLRVGERRTAFVFATVYAMEAPDRAERMLARLEEPAPITKKKNK